MIKVLRFNILVIGLVVLLTSLSATEIKAQHILGEILRRMDVHNKNLVSLQSAVTMVKHNPQLNVWDTYVGTTTYLPEKKGRVRYMRLDWSKPVIEQIAVIGKEYKLYKPSINQVYEGTVNTAKNSAGAGNALGFITMSKDELKKNYTIAFIAEENIKGGDKTAHLLLTPKSLTSYKTAEIWVDVDGMPRQVRITEMNNDTTTVLLENFLKNQKIKTEIFKLNIPNGVKKVKA